MEPYSPCSALCGCLQFAAADWFAKESGNVRIPIRQCLSPGVRRFEFHRTFVPIMHLLFGYLDHPWGLQLITVEV